jgi:hypothetical protein
MGRNKGHLAIFFETGKPSECIILDKKKVKNNLVTATADNYGRKVSVETLTAFNKTTSQMEELIKITIKQ